ncbi:MAG: RdgB/HAM1 family non-canonical purine NTP pyrophosphatase [Akkermansia muciniphila]|nr:RdgB/HAM1 family non-canonical purine NTP pyrophosphatase [Akkermansia muciniphila]
MNTVPLIIATRNRHKTEEIAAILPPCYSVHTLDEYPAAPADVEETGRSFAENARQKAETISRALPGLVLADDSGLCVDALCGAPGILSARFAGEHGNDAANNAKLLSELAALPSCAPYTARFACALSLAEGGHEVAAFYGTAEGHITLHPRGLTGFGYDPLFVPLGHDVTFAEMKPEAKNAISHRAKALQQLADYLGKRA